MATVTFKLLGKGDFSDEYGDAFRKRLLKSVDYKDLIDKRHRYGHNFCRYIDNNIRKFVKDNRKIGCVIIMKDGERIRHNSKYFDPYLYNLIFEVDDEHVINFSKEVQHFFSSAVFGEYSLLNLLRDDEYEIFINYTHSFKLPPIKNNSKKYVNRIARYLAQRDKV